MLFNSFSFLIFFPVVTVAYFATPHRFRWALLLVASCVFYMALLPYYILVLAAVICIDYAAGILIERSTGARRTAWLIMSIVTTCAVLIVFKYFNFFSINIAELVSFLHWNYDPVLLKWALPIGLSFHTFQSLSYVIEVYKGNQKAEKHFGIYALYVMFFPQLVAGPIERPQNLLHQFRERHYLEYVRITAGLQRMLWGFFKKVVIADNLALYVGQVYADPTMYSGPAIAAATLFFAVQIYCDFSGYSDIALGSAQVLGFKLMENFKNPYFALSIPEFWSRWHISLSTWFRDYVYIPLGGNRVSARRWTFNILCVFILSGIWHGANWTYIVWGLLHGVYTVAYRYSKNISARFLGNGSIATFFKWSITFILVLVTWVFFRARSVTEAWYMIKKAFVWHDLSSVFAPAASPIYFWCLVAVIAFLAVAEAIDYRRGLLQTLRAQKTWIRWSVYIVLIIAIMNLGVTREIPFIYFQF